MHVQADSSNAARTTILLSCVIVVADAQGQQPSGAAARADAIEEITVTATRRETRLQSAPPAVHAISDEELRRAGVLNFADYARTVPGLTFTDGGTGGEKQTIRGISISPWFEINSGTAVHFNEVPLTSPGGTTGPPFNPDPSLIDIERIEVLRGPQGTLFGAGSMGGAIRIISKAPDPRESTAEAGVALSSTTDGEIGYGLYGIVNAPAGNNGAALRAVLYQDDLGGFIDNVASGGDDVNNRRTRGARLTGSARVADGASVTAYVLYQDRHSGGLTHEEPLLGERKQDRSGEEIADEWLNYSVKVDLDFDWGQLMSSTSYLDRSVDTTADVSFFLRAFFGLDGQLNVINGEEIGEFVQEVRLVSDAEDGRGWIAGVFYQDTRQDISQDFPSPGFDGLTGGLASMFGPPDNLFVRRETYSLRQLALYGEVSHRLTDRAELLAGARWYDIDRHYTANNTGLLFVMGQQQEAQSAGDSGVIPTIAMSYRAGDEWSLFGRASTGFRPGGTNPRGPVSSAACALELQELGFAEPPTGYASDDVVSYEIGARYSAVDGRTRLNAAFYHVDWSDMQTQKFLNCGAGFVENAGDADSDGVELELVTLPHDNVEVFVSGSYTRAELSEDVPNLGGVTGDRLPGVPRLAARAAVEFAYPALDSGAMLWRADLQYVGDSYMGFDRSTSRRLPAHWIMNASATVLRDGWSATLFIDNAADETAAIFINDNVLGEWQTPIRPRTFGLRLNWQF